MKRRKKDLKIYKVLTKSREGLVEWRSGRKPAVATGNNTRGSQMWSERVRAHFPRAAPNPLPRLFANLGFVRCLEYTWASVQEIWAPPPTMVDIRPRPRIFPWSREICQSINGHRWNVDLTAAKRMKIFPGTWLSGTGSQASPQMLADLKQKNLGLVVNL